MNTGVFIKNRIVKSYFPIKMLIALCFCILIMLVSTEHIYGYTAVRGVVTVKSGKARKEPSTKSAFAFGVIKDEAVTIIGEEKGSDGATWYKIKVLSAVGYLRSDLVKKTNVKVKTENTNDAANTASNSDTDKNTQAGAPTEQATSANTNSPCVKGSNVIVREEASTKSGIRTVVQNGMALTVTETVRGADGKDWYKVSFTYNKNSYKGYIRSDLVNMNGTVASNTQTDNTSNNTATETNTNTNSSVQVGKIKGTGVNIRLAPYDGRVIGQLTSGDPITVTSQILCSVDNKVWFRVTGVCNKKQITGYVRSDLTEGVAIDESLTAEKKEETKTTENNETEKKEEQNTATTTTASIKGVGVRVRESAVSGNVVAHLDSGYPITILEETDGSDGYKWYKISFSKNNQQKEGFVRSDLVTVTQTKYVTELSDADFEAQISDFPDSYKASLRALHVKYPNWKFVAVNTGLEWNDVVTKECVVGKNLVAKTSITSWKSTEPQAYNWSTNTWYGFDGGSWAAASKELIMYYLDPRNFLDDSGIFQFETLEFQDYQTVEGVKNILNGTFMSGEYTDTDGTVRSYADTFYEAGKASGINPYHLAAKALQEQGTYGKSQSISGNVSGLENLFNYFNIGAYATNDRTATINGLYYAAGSDETYLRPWNTRYKSIVGSTKYIYDKYTAVGQNTLYFQKFNVVNKTNGLYSHQYMSNVVAASYESAKMKKAYPDLNTTLVFRIPVYNNMPGDLCVKPTSDSNPNTYLKNLYIEGYSFTTSFSSVVETYYVTVSQDVSSVNVITETVVSATSVEGAGVHSINSGDNTIQVVCKAENGKTKTYNIVVKKQ